MNNLNMFAKLPDGFRILENQIDRKLTVNSKTWYMLRKAQQGNPM